MIFIGISLYFVLMAVLAAALAVAAARPMPRPKDTNDDLASRSGK